jgi:hypothetical protein
MVLLAPEMVPTLHHLFSKLQPPDQESELHAPVLFERIAIDVAGPFPQSDQGNHYLLITMDYFTKWPGAYAIPDQEASAVADAQLQTFSATSEYPGNYIVTRVVTLSLACYRKFCSAWE